MSLIRVFVLPAEEGYAQTYLFGAPHRAHFEQVDWFRDDSFPMIPENEESYRGFIQQKRYAEMAAMQGRPLLVLGPQHSFTIGYEAP